MIFNARVAAKCFGNDQAKQHRADEQLRHFRYVANVLEQLLVFCPPRR